MLTDDQLKAMEPSAPLLVAEYRKLRDRHVEFTLDWVPMATAREAAASASKASIRAVLDVFHSASNDKTRFDAYHGAVIRGMVSQLRREHT